MRCVSSAARPGGSDAGRDPFRVGWEPDRLLLAPGRLRRQAGSLGGAADLGWTVAAPNLYMADLDDGANTGLFPLGLNQLFRGPERLPFGRWPNIQGHSDGGYAEVDSQPSPDEIATRRCPLSTGPAR